jgi:hypothetical protein
VDEFVKFSDVMRLMISLDVIKSDGVLGPIKPGHGPCCTCQVCGRLYDDCVCRSNEIVEELLMLLEKVRE